MTNANVTGDKPIVRSQSVSDRRAVNPIVAFYDIHGRKRDVSVTPSGVKREWYVCTKL
jgi:hypothetical protein